MSKIKRWTVLLALFFFCQAIASQESPYQTVQVVEFIRHGARTGLHPAGGEEKPASFFPGELTGNGQRMTYELGRQVRATYPDLFADIQLSEIEVYSSSMPRCQQSAFSHMLGVSELGSGGKITLDEKTHAKFISPPIANLTARLDGAFALPHGYSSTQFKISQKEMDFLFWPSCDVACPKLYKQGIAKYHEATKKYDYLTVDISSSLADAGFDSKVMIKKEKFSLEELGTLYDDLVAHLYLTGSHKGKMTDSLFKKLEVLASLRFYSYFAMENLDKLWIDELARSLVKSFTDRSAGKTNAKFKLFSGHDTTVAAFNLLFNLTSLDCLEKLGNGKKVSSQCIHLPPFASNYIFELSLHKPSQKYFVRVLLEGTPLALPSADADGRLSLDSFLATARTSLYYPHEDKMAHCGNPYYGGTPQIIEVEEKMSIKYYIILALFAIAIAALIGTYIALEVKLNKIQRLANTPELYEDDD